MGPDPVEELNKLLPGLLPTLTGYCYRMLGSVFDADDAVQETVAQAWARADSLEHPAALRSWVFRIATNVCLDMLRRRGRRALPMDLSPPGPPDGALGHALRESTWATPIPALLVASPEEDPAAAAVRHESIRLAFVAALQRLPPRQRAVLILRDVLRWRAKEVAELLGTSTIAVNGALRRARETLAHSRLSLRPSTAALTPEQQRLVDRYAAALERADIGTLVSLLHEDVVLAMPPYAFWLRGRSNARCWLESHAELCRGIVHVAVGLNGSAGFASYHPVPNGEGYEPFSIQVIDIDGPAIAAIHHFLQPRLFEAFGLPSTPVGPHTLERALGDARPHDLARATAPSA
jgi:RNA polymerase sigma-70 factor (ECF subfamily)